MMQMQKSIKKKICTVIANKCAWWGLIEGKVCHVYLYVFVHRKGTRFSYSNAFIVLKVYINSFSTKANMPYIAIACLGVIHAQKPLNQQALYHTSHKTKPRKDNLKPIANGLWTPAN